MKRCPSCGLELPLEEFPISRATKSGRYAWCKVCSREKKRISNQKIQAADPDAYSRRRKAYTEAHLKRHPERLKEQRYFQKIRREHGLSREDYMTILERQGGGCAICGELETERRMAVDHCHETGRVRGVLCGWCNPALGFFKDNTGRLAAAIQYLEVSQ